MTESELLFYVTCLYENLTSNKQTNKRIHRELLQIMNHSEKFTSFHV